MDCGIWIEGKVQFHDIKLTVSWTNMMKIETNIFKEKDNSCNSQEHLKLRNALQWREN